MPIPERSAPVILFLQGPPSVFWSELAREFEAQGARTLRVNLAAGDWLYWRKSGAIDYRGTLADWPAFLEALIRDEKVTDIVYYTDRLPYHVDAARIAERTGVLCHSIEFGYLRPDWLTLERGGMGSFSHFPNDPALIRSIAAKAPAPDMQVRFSHTFLQEAVNEVLYNMATYFGRPFYRRYQADKYYDPFFEYVRWVPRLLFSGRAARKADRLCAEFLQKRFFMLAMQLQSDYQIRSNAHYPHLKVMLEEVIGSFAASARPEDHLLIKLHPLDNGVERWEAAVEAIARRHRVEDRIAVIDGGDLGALIKASKGVIVVNSTVGLHSIQAGRPTKVLGIAVYDIAGLTHQGPLASFWTDPEPVTDDLARALVAALAATIQVKGNFYNRAGRAAGVRGIADRVLKGLVNEPDAFVTPPPRLAEALRRRAEAEWPSAKKPEERPVADVPAAAAVHHENVDQDASATCVSGQDSVSHTNVVPFRRPESAGSRTLPRPEREQGPTGGPSRLGGDRHPS